MTAIQQAKQLVDQSWSSGDFRQSHLAARAILDEVIAANPDDTTALIGLGAILSDLGEHARAVTVLEKAIALGSRDRNAHFNLAVALMNCDSARRARATGLFEKAGQMAPSPETWEAYFDPHGH